MALVRNAPGIYHVKNIGSATIKELMVDNETMSIGDFTSVTILVKSSFTYDSQAYLEVERIHGSLDTISGNIVKWQT